MSAENASPQIPSNVLVVGRLAAAGEVAAALAPDGVTTTHADSERDALSIALDLAPDVVVLGERAADDGAGADFIRQLTDGKTTTPAVVLIGRRGDSVSAQTTVDEDTSALLDAGHLATHEYPEYLPADIGATQLADHLRAKLGQRASTGAPRRDALTSQRLAGETSREWHRAGRSERPGMIAAVTVAEWAQLRRRLGSQAEEALAAAFEEWVAVDADILEQHSVRSSGGFLLLMPEINAADGHRRLRSLSQRMARTVLVIGGEHVHVTPVMGYAAFSDANSADDLRDFAVLALEEARRHLDLLPVRYSPALAAAAALAPHDRLIAMLDKLRSPVQAAFTLSLLLCLPFIIYVLTFYLGFDLTGVMYPAVAAALAVTAAILWVECFRAAGPVDVPDAPADGYPAATAIVAAYLPNEAATIVDTVCNHLGQAYPGDLQIILAYNSPQRLPIEDTLEVLAARDPRLLLLRVERSTSKAQNVNAALAHVTGEFVGVFDADHHPAPGSFERAWRWLASGHDIVQGHCVVRNGDASWVARLIAVEFETIYAVSHPGRARLHGFGIFGGSNGYWRSRSLRQIRMQGAMLTEDIDSSMRSLLDGFSIVSDPGLRSTELAPTTMSALWNQRMRWAQGWTQTALRHLGPALRSDALTLRQKVGAVFLLGWTQLVPWVTVQVLPILAFTAWRDRGVSGFDFFIPLFVLLTIFTLSVGIAQTVFAYLLGDSEVRRHRSWFIVYALHSMLWFGELKNVIARVAQLKEFVGERQWRVTPRTSSKLDDAPQDGESSSELIGRSIAS